MVCNKGLLSEAQLGSLISNASELQKIQFRDGARVNCLLNMRQSIGSGAAIQEAFRYLLMDYDLEVVKLDEGLENEAEAKVSSSGASSSSSGEPRGGASSSPSEENVVMEETTGEKEKSAEDEGSEKKKLSAEDVLPPQPSVAARLAEVGHDLSDAKTKGEAKAALYARTPREEYDTLVPPPDSALWSRLGSINSAAAEKCRKRGADFYEAVRKAKEIERQEAEMIEEVVEESSPEEGTAEKSKSSSVTAVTAKSTTTKARMPMVPITYIRESEEIRVGRHKVHCTHEDIASLRQRWQIPDDLRTLNDQEALQQEAKFKKIAEKNGEEVAKQLREAQGERRDGQHHRVVLHPMVEMVMHSHIAHVLALYCLFESPLAAHESRRSNLQMGLDPALRRKFRYELFASPFNAAVEQGKYLSKFPHVEKHFGSAGR